MQAIQSFLLLLSLFLLFLVLRLVLLDHLLVGFTGIVEESFEFLEVLLGSKLSAELLDGGCLVGDVLGRPTPRVVAGLELLQLSQDVLPDGEVVDGALVSLLSTTQDPDHVGNLVLEETQLAHSPFLPLLLAEPVDLGPEFGQLFLLLLACHHWDLGKVNNFPIANYFLLDVLVLIIFFVLLVLLWLGVFAGLFWLEHS
jgi:hypothetical protein